MAVKKSFAKKSRPARADGQNFKHSLGQNFITDQALIDRLVDAANVGENDDILEIGPGGGDMTKRLCARCKSVTAVEIDETLLPLLRVGMEKFDNFTLVHGDILRVNIHEVMAGIGRYHVVANIPYYLTTDLMNILLSGDYPLGSISVMVQKEAAQRLLAGPSTPEYGPLAIRAQYYTKPELAMIVEAACFTPPPKVDSAFVHLPWRETSAVAVKDEKRFFRVVNAAFALRRKTLLNNLISAFHMPREDAANWIARAGLAENVRGEALSLQQFADLCNAE